MRRFRDLDWLLVFLASWVAPIVYDDAVGLMYWSSLLFWLVPIGVLAPRFVLATDAGGRRRNAFLQAVVAVTALGLVLDFVFGQRILRFDDRPSQYLWLIHVPGSRVPIPVEEVLFYLLGPVAILLVYVWNDEFFLSAYNQTARRLELSPASRLVRFSPAAAWWAVGLLAVGVLARGRFTGVFAVPTYFAFLVVVAVAPAIGLFAGVRSLVNWRAFAVTTLYLLLTSVVWEVILALPRHWWGYQEAAMLGLWVRSFSPDAAWALPIEAVLVWIVTPFSVVLIYEALKAFQYSTRSTKPVYREQRGSR